MRRSYAPTLTSADEGQDSTVEDSMTGLRLLRQISLGFCLCLSGCGPDTASTSDDPPRDCPRELPASSTCDAFCEKVIVDCDAFNEAPRESCIQECECELLDRQETSTECRKAQEDAFLCTSELDCQGVFDFFQLPPPDDRPCRGAVLDVIAACEASN